MSEKNKQANSRVSELIAYITALGVSAVTVWATIRREFYTYVDGLGTFKGIKEKLKEKLDALNGKSITPNYLPEARAEKKIYSDGVEAIYKKMGVSEGIIKGSYDKFMRTGTTGKIKIGGVALIGASILVGTIINFNQRRNTAHIKRVVDELSHKDVQSIPQR